MTFALRAEARKLTTTQVLFWMVVLVVGLSLLIAGLTAGLTSTSDGGAPPMEQLINGTVGLAVLISSVLGVIGVTGEYRHLTATPTFLSIPRRGTVIAAKMITYAVTGLILGVLAVVVPIIVAAPWLNARGFEVDLGSNAIMRIVIGGIIASGIWGVIGVGFGALLRNQIAAVVGILLYRFLVEGLLASIPKVQASYPYLPGGATAALTATSNTDTGGAFDLLSPWTGGILLLAYGIVFAVVASLLTVRRDVS